MDIVYHQRSDDPRHRRDRHLGRIQKRLYILAVLFAICADLHDRCVPETEASGLGLLRKERQFSLVRQSLFKTAYSGQQFEVLLRESLIGALERKIVGNPLCASPDTAHEGVRTLGNPDVLEFSVAEQHTQRSYLQKDEDSCIDQMIYYFASTQGLIS